MFLPRVLFCSQGTLFHTSTICAHLFHFHSYRRRRFSASHVEWLPDLHSTVSDPPVRDALPLRMRVEGSIPHYSAPYVRTPPR